MPDPRVVSITYPSSASKFWGRERTGTDSRHGVLVVATFIPAALVT